MFLRDSLSYTVIILHFCLNMSTFIINKLLALSIKFSTVSLHTFFNQMSTVRFSSHAKDLCSGEPWLPISMIVAGGFLIISTAITALTCGVRSNNYHHNNGNKYQGKGSLWTIVWFFCCGLSTVIGIIFWLGIWITTSYLTITSIQKLQVKHQVKN